MITKKTIDTVGGVGSILTSIFCLLVGLWDKSLHHTIWQVWMIVCVVLLINGIAMLMTAGRARMTDKDIRNRRSSRVL